MSDGDACGLTAFNRSEEHTSELQSQFHLVCRLLLEKKKKITFDLSTIILKTFITNNQKTNITTIVSKNILIIITHINMIYNQHEKFNADNYTTLLIIRTY